ncbi:YmaF family protein [Paenibacillus sonchi]|uniref:YmaF family protein n=1 Tax=Paenibacillus sonchi TaxID=373687 RepID=UPI00398B23B4
MQKKNLRRLKGAPSKQAQRHVHEFEGSTKLAEEGADRHNHRFAGATGQACAFCYWSHYCK